MGARELGYAVALMMHCLSSRVGFGLVAAVYLLAFPYHPAMRSPNELCRLWQSRAIVDHGTLTLNETMREFGQVGDLSCAAVFQVGAERVRAPCLQPPADARMLEAWYYPSKAPLMSFLGVPVYWLLDRLQRPVGELAQVYWSRLTWTVLPTFLLLGMIRRVLREQVPAVADVLVVAYALGTMALSYSQSYMSHQPTAVLLFATFFAAWRVQRGEWRWWGWLVAGTCAGAAVMAEYTASLTVLCLALWVTVSLWRQWRRLGLAVALVGLGALPWLLGLMAYHVSAYGQPFESGYRWLNDAGYQHWHVGGFLGIRAPRLDWLVLSLVSPLRGLLALSPFLLLALWGLRSLKEKAPTLLVLVGALGGANAYFTASFDYTSWGWTVGPRHLTPLVPFLLLPVGWALERLRASGSPRRFGVAAGLLVSSIAVAGLTSFVNYIPDDVSTAVWGLAIPLLGAGTFPVTWLPAVGLANPVSGLLLLLATAAGLGWVSARLLAQRASLGVMLAVVGLHFGVLRLVTKNDDHDRNARAFLQRVWLAPSGATFDFSPRIPGSPSTAPVRGITSPTDFSK